MSLQLFIEFLKKRGHTLLIKGLPGTGKTVLALSLMEALEGKGSYISTRTHPEKLYIQYPWIKEALIPGSITSTVPQEVVTKFEELKLGDLRVIQNKILAIISSVKEPVIVLDTWDSIAKDIDYKERLKAEKLISAMVDISGAKCIFVGEEPETTTLDYQVDGVVCLHRKDIDGKTLRVGSIQKLKGVLVREAEFLFTLKNGRFQTLDRYFPKEPEKPKMVEPFEEIATHFSTGSKDLDEVLGGGFPKGSSLLLEYSPQVPNGAVALFTNQLAWNFLVHGHGVNLIPKLDMSTSEIETVWLRYIKRETINNLLRFYDVKGSERLKMDSYLIHVRGGSENLSEDFDILKEFEGKIRKESKKPVLNIIDLNSLENTYAKNQEAIIRELGTLIARCKATDGLNLIISDSGSAMVKKVLPMIDLYMHLTKIYGYVLFHCLTPKTGLFSVEAKIEHGFPQAKLTEIV